MKSLSLSTEVFRQTCARFATGVAVATVTSRDERPQGLTINSFTSVSCSPPLVLICVDNRCNVLADFRASAFFGINILSAGQRDVSVRFSQKQTDRFEGLTWHPGESGVPLLDGCLASMECSISQVIESGDHAIFIGEVSRAEVNEGEPLVFYGSAYRQLLVQRPAG